MHGFGDLFGRVGNGADDFDAGSSDFHSTTGMAVAIQFFVEFFITSDVVAVVWTYHVDGGFDALIAHVERANGGLNVFGRDGFGTDFVGGVGF